MTPPRQGRAKSTVRLIPAQRRLMQKLADRVDRVMQADRLYFEHRPDRQHRKPHTPEIEARLRKDVGARS
jgi:hypothetical protein